MIGGVPVESGQQIVQVGGGELPLERLCRGVVAVFECPSRSVTSVRSVKSLGEKPDVTALPEDFAGTTRRCLADRACWKPEELPS